MTQLKGNNSKIFNIERINRYLKKHLDNKWRVEIGKDKKFKNIIIIPAIKEFDNIKSLLDSLLLNDTRYFFATCVLFVINNSDNANIEIRNDNSLSLDYLRSIINNKPVDDLTMKCSSSNITFAAIDASSYGKELPLKEAGVGYARKIGMDLALTMFDYHSSGKNILICLDADCNTETNYLTEIVNSFNEKKLSAASINFAHDINRAGISSKAIICYEIFLRYYVCGLRYACSPYAFHTVGSAMACDAESYISIGGMNKRKAAEDFYFLEKLAKATEVKSINTTSVYPSARSSWRVPFGTGQRVTRYLAGTNNEYLLYDPFIFNILKTWLKIFHSEAELTPSEYVECAAAIHNELKEFLLTQNFEEQIKAIKQNSSRRDHLQLQKKIWFDGFRTLKLIHHLRDTALPSINMFDALDSLFQRLNINFQYKNSEGKIPGINIRIQYLEKLREIDLSS